MNMMKKILSAGLLAITASASATQLIEVDEAKTTFLQISNREPTLLRIQGDAFSRIKHRENAAIVEKDDRHGYAYITPTSAQAFTLFVTTKSGRVINMLLKPASIPGDAVVLMLDEESKPQDTAVDSADYISALKSMLTVAANDQLDHGISKREEHQPVALWAEARFIRHATYSTRNLVAEAYTLKNISHQTMVVAEPELYTKGVLGVSIERHELAPGEVTNVYIIKNAEAS